MKKGFTLVELIATIVILAIIATIVTPNILVSIRDYKEQINQTNLESIKSAAKNWSTDHINDENFPTDETTSILVTMKDLEDGSYIKEDVKDVINGGTYNDKNHFTFVLIDCIVIKDEFGEVLNYQYKYNVYTSIDDYIKTKAIEYAKNTNITSSVTLSYNELLNEGYLKNNIFYSEEHYDKTNEQKFVIKPISAIIMTVEEYGKTGDKTYEYSVTINWSK